MIVALTVKIGNANIKASTEMWRLILLSAMLDYLIKLEYYEYTKSKGVER